MAEVIGRVSEHTRGCSSSPLLCKWGLLNRDKSFSVPRTVLANNNSDEDQHSGKSGQVLSVPVINMHGKPMMPTTPKKARILGSDPLTS
ncbi:hypothetical protein IPdc08_00516 [archaeon]|nr:hypothetical protein IPdc08_00516 [archaeon]